MGILKPKKKEAEKPMERLDLKAVNGFRARLDRILKEGAATTLIAGTIGIGGGLAIQNKFGEIIGYDPQALENVLIEEKKEEEEGKKREGKKEDREREKQKREEDSDRRNQEQKRDGGVLGFIGNRIEDMKDFGEDIADMGEEGLEKLEEVTVGEWREIKKKMRNEYKALLRAKEAAYDTSFWAGLIATFLASAYCIRKFRMIRKKLTGEQDPRTEKQLKLIETGVNQLMDEVEQMKTDGGSGIVIPAKQLKMMENAQKLTRLIESAGGNMDKIIEQVEKSII